MIYHFIFQWRFSECEKEDRGFFLKQLREGKYKYWITHFLLVSGYSILFIMIVYFLTWFQGNDESYHWWNIQRLLGFYATIVIIYGTTYFLIRRIKKDR